MTRMFARAQRGERITDVIPRNRGTVTTVLGALSSRGLIATMTVEGGTTGNVFLAYLEHVLIPQLSPGDIVIADNLGAHHDKRVRPLLEKHHIQLRYLPAYSPDLNPIELCWAKFKQILRSLKARTRKALDEAVAVAIDKITPSDASAWFRHCHA